MSILSVLHWASTSRPLIFKGTPHSRRCSHQHARADSTSYKLNIWDVGGQKTIRTYWRNYFEKTDALIWVVDATDRLRIEDCKLELQGLLLEEVRMEWRNCIRIALTSDADRGWLVQVYWSFSTKPMYLVA